jgi:cellulose synthase/poly-beta-1,6-N-acetylglucosamine synthase-like glycosyltransferase
MLFFGMLILLAGLLFGKEVFSRKPFASLYGMAFSTFLLILGDVISFTGDAGEKVWMRILQLSIVVIYIVIAFRLVDYFSSSKKEITAIVH